MENTAMRKVLSLLACVLIALSTTSCASISSTIKSIQEMRKSSDIVFDFFDAISEKDFSTAEQMLHPQSELSDNMLMEYFSSIEKELDISFSEDFFIQSDVTAPSADLNIARCYVTKASIVFNKKPYVLSVLTVFDDQGTGIYSFTITPYEGDK